MRKMKTACSKCAHGFSHSDNEPYTNRDFKKVIFTCPNCTHQFGTLEAHQAFKQRLKSNPGGILVAIKELWPIALFVVVVPVLFFKFIW
jgi:hypothetical protein